MNEKENDEDSSEAEAAKENETLRRRRKTLEKRLGDKDLEKTAKKTLQETKTKEMISLLKWLIQRHIEQQKRGKSEIIKQLLSHDRYTERRNQLSTEITEAVNELLRHLDVNRLETEFLSLCKDH
ncbi:hypothetical protein EIN_155440 [Entamoeba invadens IP1]|uniref:Uncharacterized protein n=1 Tax=Entamoeba invadens IP1 TaxID=370355 RepID=A0A0A1U9C1_ENTIV|nr:hypothetical protein EIN_155440 [Entamoeba invadens IP1]ELP91437.1 hypothetical protein EIN_155440 [Entamoeba invadens IP1]|eukprot:XP_004258208.1 hypothetical protein EIN_155440 [Entamoeba invadens IP1]